MNIAWRATGTRQPFDPLTGVKPWSRKASVRSDKVGRGVLCTYESEPNRRSLYPR